MAHTTQDLSRWALLSIAAAAVTIALKMTAWLVTGSVGLLSDAAESVVNLVAAVVAFIALKVAARPADANHNFGHQKSEYFSAIIEGTCIAIAAVVIIVSAAERLMNPKDIESAGIGLLISVVAALINGAAAWALIRAGRSRVCHKLPPRPIGEKNGHTDHDRNYHRQPLFAKIDVRQKPDDQPERDHCRNDAHRCRERRRGHSLAAAKDRQRYQRRRVNQQPRNGRDRDGGQKR